MSDLKIGGLKIRKGAILAPMAGYTDAAFRNLCAMHGAAMTVTEMVSAKGLLYKSSGTTSLLYRGEHDNFCAVQLFGADPDIMAQACKSEELSPFQIIDINMGCPVKKVVKAGEGCALMDEPRLASKIISACVKAANRPVTVKFRLGFSEANFLDFGKMCQDSGASAVALHARTRGQFYSGRALDSAYYELKRALSIPVIASGDVQSAERYNFLINDLGCDAVMIGRGALGRPQIFSDFSEKKIEKLSSEEAVKLQIKIAKEYFDDKKVTLNLRKHMVFYLKGVRGGKELKNAALTCQSTQELISLVESSGVLRDIYPEML